MGNSVVLMGNSVVFEDCFGIIVKPFPPKLPSGTGR
jgi:hypothetical protein